MSDYPHHLNLPDHPVGAFPGWGEVVSAEEETVVAPESGPSVPQILEAVVYSFQEVGQDEGLRVAAENSQGRGPEIILAAQEYIQTRRMTPEELKARIAQLNAEQAKALQVGNRKAAEIAGYKIAMLRRRYTGIVEHSEDQAVKDLPDVQGQPKKWKENLPLIAIGIGALGLLISLGVVKVKKGKG